MIKTQTSILKNKNHRTNKIQGNYRKLDSPAIFTAASGNMEGEINLLWEPVEGANTYIIQKSTGSNEPVYWKQEDIITNCSYTVSKLKSGVKYWFRVAAAGSSGQGLWSIEIQKKAP